MSFTDIVKSIIDLIFIPIDYLFTIRIDLGADYQCSLGLLMTAFITIVLILYFVAGALMIGDDN